MARRVLYEGPEGFEQRMTKEIRSLVRHLMMQRF